VVNQSIKRSAERLLIGSGVAAASRVLNRGRSIALAYHNILPDGAQPAGDRSLHLSRRTFAQQLDLLARTHQVVPLDELLKASSSGRPRVAITFDDAYQGAVTTGIDEVHRRGMPATIFVAPALLNGHTFWWDSLAGHTAISDATRSQGLQQFQGRDQLIRAWAVKQGMESFEMPRYQRSASEQELHNAVAKPGITIASHSWSHANLTTLDAGEVESELIRSLSWLRERFQRVVPWLSYPYGLSSTEVARAVERSGYEGALRVDGGWLPRRRDEIRKYDLPRLNIPAGLSIDGFALRLAGVFAN
jgi:peptidoglycan/xylan/chitin deacetylase (PgdA/CDA1 family)